MACAGFNLIAVYATLCKEVGIPMRFPGSHEAYHVLVNVTGTGVLSKALTWAALEEKAENEIFNVTNGDVFRWSQLWLDTLVQWGFGDFFSTLKLMLSLT